MKAPTTPTIVPGPSKGFKIKLLRISNLLTQRELSDLAGVPQEHVDLYEKGFPVPLDSRRRILRVLWSTKTKK